MIHMDTPTAHTLRLAASLAASLHDTPHIQEAAALRAVIQHDIATHGDVYLGTVEQVCGLLSMPPRHFIKEPA